MKGSGRRPGALLLAPGAGSDRNHPTSVAIEAAVHGGGPHPDAHHGGGPHPDADGRLPVARMDFPYRKAGRRAPDRPPVLLDAVRREAAALVAEAGIRADRLVLGGRSMGGRMCSMAVADGLPAAGLVLLSYPLHPPGKPEKLRIEHLSAIEVPTLVVSGTNDPFGAPDELLHHLAAVSGPVTHVWVEGAGHEWKGRDQQVAAVVAAWLRGGEVPERLEKPVRPGSRAHR